MSMPEYPGEEKVRHHSLEDLEAQSELQVSCRLPCRDLYKGATQELAPTKAHEAARV